MRTLFTLLCCVGLWSTLVAQDLFCGRRDRIKQEEGETVLEIRDSPFRRPVKGGNPLYYRRVYESRWLHKFRLVTHEELETTDCDLEYQTVYRDDFTGPRLDSTFWRTPDQYCGPFDSIHFCNSNTIFRPENITLEDGNLVLTGRRLSEPVEITCPTDPNLITQRTWSAGFLETKPFSPCGKSADHCFQTGRFTARIKQPAPLNVVSAYWFYGWGGEIDVFEVYKPERRDPSSLYTSYHSWWLENWYNKRRPRSPTYSLKTEVADMTDWHDYVFEWEPHKLSVRFDGEDVFTLYRYFRKEAGKNGSYCLIPLECEDLQSPPDEVWESFTFDRVRYHAMSPVFNVAAVNNPTVDSVDEQRMLVDYFLLEQKQPDLLSIAVMRPFRDIYTEELGVRLSPYLLQDLIAKIEWQIDDELIESQELKQNLPENFKEVSARIFLKNRKNRCLPDKVLTLDRSFLDGN